jgi:hypothetical protein
MKTIENTGTLDALNSLSPDQLETLAKLRREQEGLAKRMQAVFAGLPTPIVRASFGKPSNSGSGKKRGRRPGYIVTDETKAKIAEGQRRRWAKAA